MTRKNHRADSCAQNGEGAENLPRARDLRVPPTSDDDGASTLRISCFEDIPGSSDAPASDVGRRRDQAWTVPSVRVPSGPIAIPQREPEPPFLPQKGAGFDPSSREHLEVQKVLVEVIQYDGWRELFLDFPFRILQEEVLEMAAMLSRGKKFERPSGMLLLRLRGRLKRLPEEVEAKERRQKEKRGLVLSRWGKRKKEE